jgi:hypothetical protein
MRKYPSENDAYVHTQGQDVEIIEKTVCKPVCKGKTYASQLATVCKANAYAHAYDKTLNDNDKVPPYARMRRTHESETESDNDPFECLKDPSRARPKPTAPSKISKCVVSYTDADASLHRDQEVRGPVRRQAVAEITFRQKH